MKRKMKEIQKLKNTFKAEFDIFGAIVLCVAIMAIGKIPCPLLFFTGVSCAGCGMTRAWICLLRMDIRGAFHFHPLFWIPPLFCLIFLFRQRIPEKYYKLIEAVMVIAFLGIYALRLYSGNDETVVFSPKDGFIFRMIDSVLNPGK